MEQTLTNTQKSILFWASFLALAACGVNFAFRIAKMGEYGEEFGLTGQEIGNIIGSCFWPIAITMILFSLVVDKTGYRWPMFGAAALMIASGLGTYFATSYEMLLLSAISIGLGHGIVEAVINPACAAAYPKTKTKMLTILHAAWPAGVVGGTLLVIGADEVTGGLDWRIHSLWILIPAVAFGLMHIPAKFPVDERVQAGVPFMDMLKEVGFFGMALAGFMLVYQIGGVLSGIFGLFPLPGASTWFFSALLAGIAIGGAFGLYVKSFGKPLFFLLCLLMIPVATAELSTDGWIKELMNPVLGEYAVWAIVFSAGVMFLLRMFAGGVLRFFNPPMLMATSGVLSAVGLYWLGTNAAGIAIFVAFFIYAVGQTYYWPCILGFVAERFPRGGALTLNLVSAMALLSLGIVGNPILGVARDKSVYNQSEETQPKEFVEVTTTGSPYLWMVNDVIDQSAFPVYGATKIAGGGEAVIAALAPSIEGNEGLTTAVGEAKEALDEQAKDEEVTAGWTELGITQIDIEAIKTYQLVKANVEEIENEEEKQAALAALKEALPEVSQDGLKSMDDAVAKHGELTVAAGRDVLVFAAIFPGILVVCFAAIAIYFRSIGGYKPIELLKDDPETTEDHVTEAPGSEM
ncbi:MAG: MFS transporter [Planctomycetota bacterium]